MSNSFSKTMLRVPLTKYKLLVTVVVSTLAVLVVVGFYLCYVVNTGGYIFSPPTLNNWFGTDVIGNDIFLSSMYALFVALASIAIVLPAIYIGGLVVGIALSYFDNPKIREFFLNLVHYWITLPILLIAVFVVVLVGAGQGNVIAILIFVLIPTQSLYVYNQMEEVKKRDFIIAERSYGFSKGFIFLHYLLPYIKTSFNIYTLSRMPEILMMDLALNFLRLGVQPPSASFGNMLLDGLSFMFSAWWMWIFPVILVVLLFVLITWVSNNILKGRERLTYGQL